MSKKFKKIPRNWTEAKKYGWKTLIGYSLSFGKEIDYCPSINCLEIYEKKFGEENEKKGLATKIDGFTYYRPDFVKNAFALVSEIEKQVSDLVEKQEKRFKEISEEFGDDIYRFFYWRNRDKFIEYETGCRCVNWIELNYVIDELKDDPELKATYKRELDRIDWISFFDERKFVEFDNEGKEISSRFLIENNDWQIATNYRKFTKTPIILFNKELKEMVKDTIVDYILND